jgi:hypothetical protein
MQVVAPWQASGDHNRRATLDHLGCAEAP